MKERKNADGHLINANWQGNPRSTMDLALDKARYNQWLSAVRAGDDIRNRIAVSGGNLSHGSFGKYYLLVTDKPPLEVHCPGTQVSNCLNLEPANEAEFAQPALPVISGGVSKH